MQIINLVILPAIIGLMASFLFSITQRKRRFSILPLFFIAILIVIHISSYSPLSLPINPYKELFTFLRYPDTEILFEDENSFSQIKVVQGQAVK
jgi:hypothetical protein